MTPINGSNYHKSESIERSSTPYKSSQLPKVRRRTSNFRYDFDLIKERLTLHSEEMLLLDETPEIEEPIVKQKMPVSKKGVLNRSLPSLMREATDAVNKSERHSVLFTAN